MQKIKNQNSKIRKRIRIFQHMQPKGDCFDNQGSLERLDGQCHEQQKQKYSNKSPQQKAIGYDPQNELIKPDNKIKNMVTSIYKRLTLGEQKKQKYNQKRISFNLQNRDNVQTNESLQKMYKINRHRGHNDELTIVQQDKIQKQSIAQTNDIALKLKARRTFNNSLIMFNDREIISSYQQIQENNDIEGQKVQMREDDRQSNNSSQNIFQIMKKRQQKRQRITQQSELQQSNIFQKYKKIQKERQSSDSDQDNIFQRVSKKQQSKTALVNSFHGKSYSLQNILDASALYDDYLAIKKLKTLTSLNIPQLQPGVSSISKRFFFKPERIEFKRFYEQLPVESIYSSSNFLCKLNKKRGAFYFQDLKEAQPHNLDGYKCSQLLFQQKDKIGKNIEHDHINQRFYIFSNKEQKLFIYSSSSFELLCKVSIKKNVFDPNLHFYHINNRCFLMIIGGYVKIQKLKVTGSNYIQIFEINKWQVILKSKLIKLIIGRINPIILSNETNMIIIGGNSIAEIDIQGKLNYNYQKSINQSTNMTGVIINTQEISQLFDYEEQVNVQNISVKVNNPHILHSGIAVAYQNSFLLILPNAKNLFYVKFFYKQVNIIQTNKTIDLGQKTMKNEYQKRELTLKVDRHTVTIYRINSQGILRLIPCQLKQKQFCCNIY